MPKMKKCILRIKNHSRSDFQLDWYNINPVIPPYDGWYDPPAKAPEDDPREVVIDVITDDPKKLEEALKEHFKKERKAAVPKVDSCREVQDHRYINDLISKRKTNI